MADRPLTQGSRRAAALLATLPFALVAAPLAAQSYAVVQPVPPPANSELSAALQRLARNPNDFEALLSAGRASLALDDVDAAIGFFGRAQNVRAGDPRVTAGLASANLKSGRPIEALQLFEQAQAAGAAPAALAKERGLAFDLVGDNASAQIQYRLALGQGRDDEVMRRLSLSQAIAGDARAFEATLLPLLQRRDLAAYRARAFGLAILGQEKEAVSIVEAVMPRDLAGRMTPYLAYMPRLTRAQQAAAANLGNFPRAAQIGREDPRFAQYAGPQSAAPPRSAAESRLAPAGEPLGPRSRVGTRSERRPANAAPRSAPAAQPARAEPKPPVVVARADPISPPAARSVAATPLPPPPPPPAPAPPPPPPAAPAIVLPVTESRPAIVAALPPASESTRAEPPVIILPVESPPPAAAPAPATLADVFAEFAIAAEAQTAAAAGAVDVTAITPKREVAKPPPSPPPPPPPPKPKAPSRIWVQVATGKDTGALAFDWRRFGKKAPELLGKRSAYTAKWGESRRLLTGPIDSAKAANKLVADLKAAGINAFAFTSADGEEVAALK